MDAEPFLALASGCSRSLARGRSSRRGRAGCQGRQREGPCGQAEVRAGGMTLHVLMKSLVFRLTVAWPSSCLQTAAKAGEIHWR